MNTVRLSLYRRRRGPRLALLVPIALLVSCVASNPGNTPEPDDPGPGSPGTSSELEVAMHGETSWSATGLVLAFTGVESDSRCPEGANCVWAGNAVVELAATRRGLTERFSLRFGPAGTEAFVPEYVDRLRFRFEVVRLAPTPRAGQTIDKLSYRVTVRATIL